jgi:hypothetical protein
LGIGGGHRGLAQVAQRRGQVALVDDRKAVRGAGDRDVEVVAAVRGLGDDARRVGEHHPVELEALRLRHGEQRGRRVEGLRPVTADRLRNGSRQFGGARVRGDHREAPAVGSAEFGQVSADNLGDGRREHRRRGDADGTRRAAL